MVQPQSPPASSSDSTQPMFYMEIQYRMVDARLGKMRPGQVVIMTQAKAERYLSVGAAKQTTVSAWNRQIEEANRKRQMTQAQGTFQDLNRQYAQWDPATYRDVLTAPESGLRIAVDRGIPLVNVHMLRDEQGNVLAPDADIEDILDARELYSTQLVVSSAHSMPPGGPMPLSPQYRATLEHSQQVRGSPFAQAPKEARRAAQAQGERPPPASERAARAFRRTRELPVAGEALDMAEKIGVIAPSGEITPDQQGN